MRASKAQALTTTTEGAIVMADQRLRYPYSTHKTELAAEEALEDYFATGEVCEGEHPTIVRRLFHGRVRYVIELES
jgi:hypothetical protein